MKRSLFCAGLLLWISIAGVAENKPSTANFISMTVTDNETGQPIINGETINQEILGLEVTVTTANVNCLDLLIITGSAEGNFPQNITGASLGPYPIGPQSNSRGGNSVQVASGLLFFHANETGTVTISTMCSGTQGTGGASLTFYDTYVP